MQYARREILLDEFHHLGYQLAIVLHADIGSTVVVQVGGLTEGNILQESIVRHGDGRDGKVGERLRV